MDSSLILRQQQQQTPRSYVILRNSDHLIGGLKVSQIPTSLRQRMSSKSTSLVSRTRQTITAKKKSLEGVSDELNTLASQDLSQAPARRSVRSAFVDVQQHLDHVLFKMAPPGIRTEEWYEVNSKGFEIFCKSWLPKADFPIKAALCFCHGYGDTCTFFFEGIARRIAASGYGVYAMDYPYFGLSEGLHGYIPSFDGLVDDVIEQYSNVKARPEVVGLPRFIMGQSMGGAVTLKVHLKQPHEWDGVILVAPMAKADYNVISYSDQMRLRTAVELLKATRDIESQLEKISSPLLVLHGAADKVTDPLVSKFLYEKASSKDKTLKLYEEGYHSILEGEPDDRILKVLDDIVSWLDCHCALK
ncbi:caffeoylshikimate esterase-like isoform X2 [Telopea speciosissima]|uniref:caffeoylshikimate esterase-like isoform X2 n=1 Tax=Telopea speciosissima TaxID=54955 RepID=UPI001CC67E50|nr:caffeoylshikimate esterase-like isoform X2 [Telopea speciosissima]